MQSTDAFELVAPAAPRRDETCGAPFVSQFLLGPARLEFPGWRHVDLSAALKLSVHPALPCVQAAGTGGRLALLGHMLDPSAPGRGNEEILRTLLAEWSSRDALIAATARLGGRWLLIAIRNDESFLFHDALGLRQAFYTDARVTGERWVMSQPGIATAITPLAPDPLAMAYLETETFRRTQEHRLPGNASTFVGLKRLLPNHWLDLNSGEVRRYWPTAPIEPIELDSALDRLLAWMPGLIRAAATRHDLALALTAGVDSRLVLAAARGCIDRVRVVTIRQGRQPDGHPDVEVPTRLLRRLGLTHDIIHAPSMMSAAFAWQFKRNVYLAHDHYGHDAEAIVQHYGRTHAALTGSGAEVGRSPFRGRLPWPHRKWITPASLAWLEFGSAHPFLLRHLTDWLAGAQSSAVDLLDLYEWEQGHGSWLAMTQLEFDIAWREIFTPYNCRAVLATLLAVPERHRRECDPRLWRAYIERAWPALLDEPINPHKKHGRWHALRNRIRHTKNYWMFTRRVRALHAVQ